MGGGERGGWGVPREPPNQDINGGNARPDFRPERHPSAFSDIANRATGALRGENQNKRRAHGYPESAAVETPRPSRWFCVNSTQVPHLGYPGGGGGPNAGPTF